MRYLIVLMLFAMVPVRAQQQFSVYFDSRKSELKTSEATRLKTWMDSNKDIEIVAINGYTDEDGTTGFNDSLAQRRVDFIYRIIKDRLTIRDDFKTRSFGEVHKQSATKAENRKATIYYIEAKDLARENEILGIKPAAETPGAKPRPEVHYPEKIVLQNPDGSTSEVKLDTTFMARIGQSPAGEKLKIENLNFIVNTFAVAPSSRSKLYELLIVMEQNPRLKIELQGHLCCMPVDRLDLSTQRAKAVYSFLALKGIDKSRLSYKGFGSSQPVYPLPEKNEDERSANRRVEVYIVAND